jgi:hypothetical protein
MAQPSQSCEMMIADDVYASILASDMYTPCMTHKSLAIDSRFSILSTTSPPILYRALSCIHWSSFIPWTSLLYPSDIPPGACI